MLRAVTAAYVQIRNNQPQPVRIEADGTDGDLPIQSGGGLILRHVADQRGRTNITRCTVSAENECERCGSSREPGFGPDRSKPAPGTRLGPVWTGNGGAPCYEQAKRVRL